MEGTLIVLGLIYVIFLIWNVSTDDKYGRFCSAILLIISIILFVILLLSYNNRNTPTALDVYQGKTTLEITYRDNIPIDSVVVFKDEFKK